MKIVFYDTKEQKYVQKFRMVAGHIYEIVYTDNLQLADIVSKSIFENPGYMREESFLQEEFRRLEEKGIEIIPLDVHVSLPI